MSNLVRPVLVLFSLLTVLTGLGFPLLVTGIGRWAFPHQTEGSLVMSGGVIVGSSLIGQSFQDPKYFWGRLSATSPMSNNASASSGSNLGPTNPALIDAVKARVDALRAADPGNTLPIPADLVTASASGLDPHVSPAAALYQVARIAKARHLSPATITSLVNSSGEGSRWIPFEEPRVNVLLLNLALNHLDERHAGL